MIFSVASKVPAASAAVALPMRQEWVPWPRGESGDVADDRRLRAARTRGEVSWVEAEGDEGGGRGVVEEAVQQQRPA